jgi:methionyl-tRNA formyltransferase
LGTFNLHASLLPQYRGAAPINHVLINGETTTGVTTFYIDNKIDTGNILLRKEITIGHDDNAGALHDKLMREGAKLTVKTTELIYLNMLKATEQDQYIKSGEVLFTAPKIFTEDCYIDWNQPSERVFNFIRGLSPYPGARTSLKSEKREISIKIYSSHQKQSVHNLSPGTILTDNKLEMNIATSDGFIAINKIQPEGKRKMGIDQFLRGFNLTGFKAT